MWLTTVSAQLLVNLYIASVATANRRSSTTLFNHCISKVKRFLNIGEDAYRSLSTAVVELMSVAEQLKTRGGKLLIIFECAFQQQKC